jgi:uncharacterized GH25 family protein
MLRTLSRRFFSGAAFALLVICPAAGHEFWLEPAEFAPRVGQSVAITVREGVEFKGKPVEAGEFQRFVMLDARGERPIKMGGGPALKIKLSEPGLSIFSYYSKPETTTFETWEKFERYLQEEGLEHIGPLHRQQKKPTSGIKEIFSRCAKLLVNVEQGAGEDRFTGMPLELVAEKNPYTLQEGEELPVRLLHNGKPAEDIQIVAISKADPKTPQRVRTDGDGRVRLALNQKGPWLLNAIHIGEPSGEKAHWFSLWASMTFAR